ncbi:MAG: hypothetical protein EB828_05785 [Nitrosopumilus sp. D6]|nr:MAG: hypothetical protein EB828_05785 [Nitrosopumilus sp. D6]
MDRIKSLSLKVLETHKSKFGKDFADNKKALNQIAIVRSKGLKNEIAGHITNIIKREQIEEEAKLARIKAAQAEEAEQKAMADAEKKRADSKEESADTDAIPNTETDSGTDAHDTTTDSSLIQDSETDSKPATESH